jgi:hypothetical protein
MKKINKLFLLIIIAFIFVNCSKINKNLRYTLIMTHSLEAPQSVYSFIKKSNKINPYYRDKAILVSFELDQTVIKSADETIFQFDRFGKLILYKHINGEFSKLLIKQNIKSFIINDVLDAPEYGFVIDGSKLFEK